MFACFDSVSSGHSGSRSPDNRLFTVIPHLIVTQWTPDKTSKSVASYTHNRMIAVN